MLFAGIAESAQLSSEGGKDVVMQIEKMSLKNVSFKSGEARKRARA
jgi:hypothetical protein